MIYIDGKPITSICDEMTEDDDEILTDMMVGQLLSP